MAVRAINVRKNILPPQRRESGKGQKITNETRSICYNDTSWNNKTYFTQTNEKFVSVPGEGKNQLNEFIPINCRSQIVYMLELNLKSSILMLSKHGNLAQISPEVWRHGIQDISLLTTIPLFQLTVSYQFFYKWAQKGMFLKKHPLGLYFTNDFTFHDLHAPTHLQLVVKTQCYLYNHGSTTQIWSLSFRYYWMSDVHSTIERLYFAVYYKTDFTANSFSLCRHGDQWPNHARWGYQFKFEIAQNI